MFIGEYSHSVDQKGRLAVPTKFRKLLGSNAVVTRGLDNSLFLYTNKEWKKLAEKLAALPFSHKQSRAFARLMLAGAMEVTIDKQGRIMLPDYLRTFAKIKKKAVMAGLYNRIEIWDKAAWEKYKKATEKESGVIAEDLFELGI